MGSLAHIVYWACFADGWPGWPLCSARSACIISFLTRLCRETVKPMPDPSATKLSLGHKHNKVGRTLHLLPSKHTTSPQRREDVLLGRREDVLFAPTLGWKDVFWRRLEKTSSRRLVDVKAWRRIIVVFWLILCWKDVFATLYVRCL